MTDDPVFERFGEENFPDCFKEYADLLDWYEYWHTTLDTSTAAVLEVVRRRQDQRLLQLRGPPPARSTGTRPRSIFVPEPEDEAITAHHATRSCYVRVNEFAALLRDFCGLKTGDRVTLHMPMVRRAAGHHARLRAARRHPLAGVRRVQRQGLRRTAIADSGSRVLITMDGYYRAGELIDHKEKADKAVDEAAKEGQKVEKVLVWQRHPGKYSSPTPMVEGRDFFVDELLSELPRQAASSRRPCRPRRRCS